MQDQLDDLGREWRSGGISNEFFFANVRLLEGRMTQVTRLELVEAAWSVGPGLPDTL
ncbi:hypothetical protein KZZ52_55585 [Dactylosporangium sp. AC04546]|uniref:hypothetical protein n=1 Tax=Dactylosporangium sp. AC04546 TaxID=2862460 RepID=UPI001EE0DA5D|nr:hypothetical protein [Dactylosporangium sp. AC04546]WVK83050.1 hypothetical protein KZZ52_55585 [Dactylosporangium sp. AC04546]